MKLSVLTENTASQRFIAEHGLSYLIEHDGEKLLFDTGYSDVFLQNASKLNINIDDVEKVVLSHGHWDHSGGLRFINNKILICHPQAFIKRFRKDSSKPLENILSFGEIKNRFQLIMSSTPYRISDNIIFLGEIPRLNSFESQKTSYITEDGKDDFVRDDSALAIISNKELVIAAGCSHSGICNIIDYAKKVSGIKKVKAVIGGFHLKEDNEQVRYTIDYFTKENIPYIYPSHCTELPALAKFHTVFNTQQVKTGMIFNF